MKSIVLYSILACVIHIFHSSSNNFYWLTNATEFCFLTFASQLCASFHICWSNLEVRLRYVTGTVLHMYLKRSDSTRKRRIRWIRDCRGLICFRGAKKKHQNQNHKLKITIWQIYNSWQETSRPISLEYLDRLFGFLFPHDGLFYCIRSQQRVREQQAFVVVETRSFRSICICLRWNFQYVCYWNFTFRLPNVAASPFHQQYKEKRRNI